jgi:ubiquinone/menaquinone biosynthesis C-methylase UbiE
VNWHTDPTNLRTLYADPTPLRERQRHYAEPAQGPGFVDWALDLVDLGGAGRVLDVGAGTGRFTLPLARACRGRVVACDLFRGMVDAVRDRLSAEGLRAQTLVADAAALPFGEATFDLVFANHMLYHVPDLPRAVGELARVTRPGGTCMATTNADDVPIPVIELHHAAMARLGMPGAAREVSSFSLRNGERQLADGFRDVTRHVYRAETVHSSPDELLSLYRTTGRFQVAVDTGGASESDLVDVAGQICRKWFAERGGRLVSPLVMGAFVCRRPRA